MWHSKLNNEILTKFFKIVKILPKNFQCSALCGKMHGPHEKFGKCSPSISCREKKIPNESSIIYKPEHPSDVYLRTQKVIKTKATELTNYLDKSKISILEDIEKQMHVARLQDIDDIRRILCSIDKRIESLIELDLKCAHRNKMKVYEIHDRANQSMKACDNLAVLAINKLQMEIEQLIEKTCNNINLVLETINSCKNSKTPQCLEKCLKSKGYEAVELLDELNNFARKRMSEFEEVKEDSIRQRKLISKQISKDYQRASHDLSELLAQYIKRLDNQKPLFKRIF